MMERSGARSKYSAGGNAGSVEAMQIHSSLAESFTTSPVVLTIGAFDGIHLGHQRLMAEVRAAASAIHGASAVMTFDPHPDRVLWPDRERLYLTTLDERLSLLASLGIEHTIVLPFDRELARVPAEEFMQRVCATINLRELWIGPDFRLGAGGRGTATVLAEIGRKLGYRVKHVERIALDEQPVSSTAIRQRLSEGDVAQAARLLGRRFELHGVVVHGDHRGRTIGIPTANLATAADQFIPADGVYACYVFLPGESQGRPAVTNIGVRPTFDTKRRTVEAHLLDWSGDIYDATIGVQFVQRLRGEQRFSGIDALLAQIHADIAAARELLV